MIVRKKIKEKVKRNKKEIKHLIQKYKSIKALKELHNDYMKSKNRRSIEKCIRQGHTDYCRLIRMRNNIKKWKEMLHNNNVTQNGTSRRSSIERNSADNIHLNSITNTNERGNDSNSMNEISPNDNSNHITNHNTNENDINEQETTICECFNCKRRQHPTLHDEDSIYYIRFSLIPSTNISARKFKHPRLTTNQDRVSYNLCHLCESYLTLPDNYNKEKYCWPSFLIRLLENKEVHRRYNSHIWRFIPYNFRFWWLDYIQREYPEVFEDVTLLHPEPIFDDVTADILAWKQHTSNPTLPGLASICNQLLIPKIMCPWGDSVFIHKFGSVSMDIIFQRYIEYCEIDLMNINHQSKVKWTRNDYIRDEKDNDTWLLNPDWKIRPSIAFIDGSPRILTCQEHNGGTADIMIHPCRWKHNLPSQQPDQIAQVVVQSRTIRFGKASSYSTEWQMFEQKGSFGGIDTCNHVEFGNFEKHSVLRFENEDKSISNRYDLNAHLDVLCKHDIISNHLVDSMRSSAQSFLTQNQDLSKYYKGATYVPLEKAIAMQIDNSDRDITISFQNNEINENQRTTQVKIKRYWPIILYPCQRPSKYGAPFTIVPSFTGGIINKTLWKLSAVMTQVESVWKCVCNSINHASNWFGWILTYLTHNCFNDHSRQSQKDPFKLNQIRTIENIRNKIPSNIPFHHLFNNINGVLCIHLNRHINRMMIQERILNEGNYDAIIITSNALDEDQINCMNDMGTLNIGNDVSFHLNCCIVYYQQSENRWTGEIFSRHYGDQFTKYWYQRRGSNSIIKKKLIKDLNIGKEYTFVYSKKKAHNYESLRNKYLKLLGGQIHVQCSVHKKPLIVSYDKTAKCRCGKKCYYCCNDDECQLRLCKKCFKAFNVNSISFIDPLPDNRMDVDSDGDNVRSEEMSFTDDNEEIRDGDDVIDGVNLENYVTMSEEHEYLVDDTPLLQNNEDNNGDQESVTFTDFIPTTNAGEIAVAVEEKTKYGFKFAGSNILNNVGSLLARSGFDICKSRYVNHNIQKLCSVTNCESIPIVYPEGMLFPSIHWKCSVDKCSILGAIPSSLLNANANKYGFASIPQHIRTRLTCPSCTTSSDPRYITHCYDVMANMAASQCDTRLVINRGLTVGKEIYGNLGVRGNNDSTLLGSVDSKQMVKNLCTSQKYVKWDYFLTFTANQSCHFGLKPIRKWIENKGWASIYPGYNDLNETYQREIDDAVNQASAGLMLRVWEEVSILFLEFITKSPHSPYLNVKATFARREYQSNSGNLAHSHIIIGINEAELTREQKAFVDNLACGSVFDVVRCDNIEKYIKKGIIHSQDEIPPLVDNAIAFLTHKCSNRCLVKTSTGQLRCRMPQYMRMTPDNSKQNFVDLPITISDECWKRLHRIGLANDVLNVKGERNVFKSSLGYFHPKRWIPAVVPGEAPVSPFEGQTFAVCKSMQNCQRLDEAGGCCKYTCKYLGKIDKQNYVTISMSKTKKDGSIQSNSTYLHNTKITASDIQQEKEKNTKRDKHHPDGRCVSLTEMLHVMLQYHEVYTDLIFVSISTMPLELRCSQKLVTDAETEDGMYTDTVSSLIRSQKTHFPQWRKHSISEIIIMNDIKQSKMGYDKVTQFSLRPCELKTIVDMVGHYYRWFIIEMKQKLTGEEMDTLLNDDLRMSPWIDGLQRKVKLRKSALPEILEWCSYLETEESDQTQGRVIMIQLIRDINTVISETRDILNEDDSQFLSFILKHLIYDDSKEDHLPIPVFSYIRPNNAVQFLNHILISMGRFSTEIDLMTHGSIKESFQHAKLIGNEDTEDKLVEYSNDLLKKYITEQVRYFPNSIKTIDAFIIMAGEVFDNAIIKNAIAMTDMPPVQFSLLARSMEDKMIKNRRESLKKTIDAIYIELDELINTCNIPSKEELLNATLNNPCNWDPIASFTKGINQSEESFNEQKFAIQTCIQAIDSITNLSDQLTMTKSIVIRGHPGAGKSFCMMYVIVYAICQGLFQMPVAKMTHRGLQIGGINWDKLLGLRGSENNVGIHRRAELAIARLKRERIKEDVLLSLNILFADELGQLSAEELSLFEMILRNVRGSSSFMGGVLVIGTMDHLQIQPINGRPFLTANSIIPCFKMVALRNSVRATGDLYVELQSLVRRDYRDFEDEPQLLTRIRRICSDIFTFVDNWNHEKITPHTFRVFSKKFPGKEALNEFQSRLFRKYNNNPGILRQRSAQDFQKSRYGHDWMVASEETSNILDKNVVNLSCYFLRWD